MIVRILTEGQFNLPGAYVDELNDLDNAVVEVVADEDRDGFDKALKRMLDLVREHGTPVPVDELVESDLVLPEPDITLEEAEELFIGEGADPGLGRSPSPQPSPVEGEGEEAVTPPGPVPSRERGKEAVTLTPALSRRGRRGKGRSPPRPCRGEGEGVRLAGAPREYRSQGVEIGVDFFFGHRGGHGADQRRRGPYTLVH